MLNTYGERERAWLWLNDVLGANVSLTEKLIFCNEDILSLYNGIKSGGPVVFPEHLGEAHKRELIKRCSESRIDSLIENMEKLGIYAVTRDDAGYPALLREIYDPPTVLYIKGKPPEQAKLPIAVIGSRNCSDYGREMAGYFGRELAANGACIVSGLAAGCDSEAANGALSASGNEFPTIAVLGCGADVVYPSSSRALYEKICAVGSVISEFKPGKGPTRESFPQRNRIISGLSKGVLVIEAGAKSGTRITVEFAHEQGRDVFAVPGRITDLLSVGTNGLIKSGAAKAVFAADDILYEYGIFLEDPLPPIHSVDLSKLEPGQRKVCELLIFGEKTVDSICEATGFSVADVNMYLTELELSGIIKQLPNGEYAV